MVVLLCVCVCVAACSQTRNTRRDACVAARVSASVLYTIHAEEKETRDGMRASPRVYLFHKWAWSFSRKANQHIHWGQLISSATTVREEEEEEEEQKQQQQQQQQHKNKIFN